ncbi:MAG: hypothetical protein LBV27_09545, partial [Oscillospiraceae bacterium]|nr:hypothetical protein [Oscillospiraceae bacterium]
IQTAPAESTGIEQAEGSELVAAVLNYENDLLSKLAETEAANDIMDVHYAYNNLIEFYYKYREASKEYFDKAIFYCQKDVILFPTLKPLFMADLQMIPRIPAFQRLAMLYDQRGEYEKAIEICGLGIKYDLADGTQGGFRARRERIEKKLIEAQNA